jgi:hypothetical protein
MLQRSVSARADGLQSGDDLPALRSIALISMPGTSHAASISLVVSRPAAERESVPLLFHQQAPVPSAIGLEIILIVTLSFLMGSLVKTRFSPS